MLAGGHFDVDLSALERLAPNVRLLGQRPYEEMPKLLWSFDVCIIPFLVNDITDATEPGEVLRVPLRRQARRGARR